MKKIEYTTYEKPSDFMKFDQGDTKIRIISSGGIGLFHAIRAARYVPLGLCTEDDTCKHCKDGNQPKRIWRWIVADLKKNQVKILDAGPMLGNQICEIGKVNGDPQEYDIVVNKSGLKLQTKYEARKSTEKSVVTEAQQVDWKPMKAYLIKKYFA